MQRRIFAWKVLLISVLVFCVILAGLGAAFISAMRQKALNETLERLSNIIETGSSQFTAALDGQISLVVNMAESPVIRAYLQNPGNAELARLALGEFNANKKTFPYNKFFRISDVDKRYYLNDKYSYTLDPDDPENVWYAPLLNQKERYSFDVYFDIDINRVLCRITALVYDDNNIPIGFVGTEFDMTEYTDIFYNDLDEDVTLLLFDNLGEITGAQDLFFIERRTFISELWESGQQVFLEAQSDYGETKSFIINNTAYAVGKISRLNWYIAVSKPITK
jgi:methyl-accepting chemotaxis protein